MHINCLMLCTMFIKYVQGLFMFCYKFPDMVYYTHAFAKILNDRHVSQFTNLSVNSDKGKLLKSRVTVDTMATNYTLKEKFQIKFNSIISSFFASALCGYEPNFKTR